MRRLASEGRGRGEMGMVDDSYGDRVEALGST